MAVQARFYSLRAPPARAEFDSGATQVDIG